MRGSNNLGALHELLSTRYWMVNFDSVPVFRSAIERNLNSREPINVERRVVAKAVAVNSADKVLSTAYTSDGDHPSSDWAVADIQEDFVSVIYVTDAITRNGGLCALGSIDHRDLLMAAANNPHCMGHVFYIDTPGGSAYAINDYELAIDYARSLGQPVFALVDGFCCSAGMYLAALCDQRYYMHPQNQIGCIGVMAAFYTEKDGSFNEYTNETYHELYDPESFDKNKSWRDIANDGDATEMTNHLAEMGIKFRNDVKAHCPNVTDEMLHGKIFDAADVTGALMDGQSTLAECCERIIAIRKPDDQDPQAGVEAGKQVVSTLQSSQSSEAASSKSFKIDMNTYPNINQTLALPEGTSLEVTEEGAFMQPELLDRIEQRLALEATEREQAFADMHEAAVAHEAAALEEANQQHEAAVAQLNEQHASELAALRDQIASLTSERDALTQQRDQLAQQHEELQQQLTDVQAELAAATAAPQTDEQAAPSNNGTGLETPKMVSKVPTWDPSKTPTENKEALQAYLAGLRKS